MGLLTLDVECTSSYDSHSDDLHDPDGEQRL